MALKLRSNPIELRYLGGDVEDINKRHDFFNTRNNPQGKGIEHQYEVRSIQGDSVVIDKATGLMWQKDGSPNSLTFDDAKQYIVELNQNNMAGFSDWRLPTLEEAQSLMEASQKNGGLYIDSVFNTLQKYIWTSDYNESELYGLYFNAGYHMCIGANYDHWVRAVRSML